MSDAPLRAAVVGVGHLGQHHARLLAAIPGVRLVAVVDIQPARAAEVAARTPGVAALTDHRELVGAVDLVTIAAPTESHRAIAEPFLARGTATLVEKPLARSSADADAMLARAESSGAVFAVGHTERHNPAVQAASALITRPGFIEVHRLGAFPDRSLDVDVVFDLMIHDLDVVLSLVHSEVESIDAVGIPVLTPRVDIANVRLRFASGCIANLTASRISRDRVRKIRFFQPASYLSIDYGAQTLEAWRLVRRDGQAPAIEGGPIAVPTEEPLKLELEDFVRAARTHGRPLVSGADGRRALQLAEAVTAKIAEGLGGAMGLDRLVEYTGQRLTPPRPPDAGI